jgi:hypothetical protein
MKGHYGTKNGFPGFNFSPQKGEEPKITIVAEFQRRCEFLFAAASRTLDESAVAHKACDHDAAVVQNQTANAHCHKHQDPQALWSKITTWMGMSHVRANGWSPKHKTVPCFTGFCKVASHI